jgi:hypothetical protein
MDYGHILHIVDIAIWHYLMQIITSIYAEWLVSYNLLDRHFHTGFDDG